jgi:hypothetical protein
VVLRRALRWLVASRRCTASNCSAVTTAGTGTVIHSSLGCAVVLWPLPIGSSADLRRRAGAVRSRPLVAWPLQAGLVSSPRIVVGRQIGLPVGVGTRRAVSCAASPCSVTPPAL